MFLDRRILGLAGSLILLASLLAYYHSPAWLLLTGAIGLNLISAALTRFCPLAWLFARLGAKPTCCATDK